MATFKRKKKQGSTESFKLITDFNSPNVPLGSNISKSDVVKIELVEFSCTLCSLYLL